MTAPERRRTTSGARPRVGVARIASMALMALLLLASCSSSSDDATGSDDPAPVDERELSEMGPAADPPLPVNPTRHIGPQGRVGQFVASCDYTHSSFDDPIVWRDQPGRSHRHEFYGALDVDASSRPEELVERETSCDKTADKAAYWHPTLYDHGEPVVATELHAYYRAAPGVDPSDVEPFPFGIALVTGDMMATEPQEGEATGWTCGTSDKLSDDAPECPPTAHLTLVLTFQDCWDGEHLDSEDHRSHVTYSEDGACPDTHPVHLPQLVVTVEFPIHGPGHDLSLASGNLYSAHGDFLNAWEPAGLAREVDACIRRDLVCDIVSNRREEPLFTG